MTKQVVINEPAGRRNTISGVLFVCFAIGRCSNRQHVVQFRKYINFGVTIFAKHTLAAKIEYFNSKIEHFL
jgi:accessory colonization factor AcfC